MYKSMLEASSMYLLRIFTGKKILHAFLQSSIRSLVMNLENSETVLIVYKVKTEFLRSSSLVVHEERLEQICYCNLSFSNAWFQ